MSREQSLYWYGLKAIVVQYSGVVLIALSLIFSFNKFALFGGLIIGVILIFKGRAMRFEYKMHSGSIIHRGDW